MSLRKQGTGPSVRIRHIPFSYSDLSAFGDHYITQDPSLRTATQFDITVFTHGDDRRPAGDPLRATPHIRIRTWSRDTPRTPMDAAGNGDGWQVISVTPIPA